MHDVAGVVLAAGKGTRMRDPSGLPKVLAELSGRPLILHVLAALGAAGVARAVVVVGYRGDAVREAIDERDLTPLRVDFVEQTEQLGTAHAVLCALPKLASDVRDVLILSGDVPCVGARTLARLVEACRESDVGCALASFRTASPTGYGRIVRDSDGAVVAIREELDATDEERKIDECNAGLYCVSVEALERELPLVRPTNKKGEFYLTDLVARLVLGGRVAVVQVDEAESVGVNTPEQLAELERLAATTPIS